MIGKYKKKIYRLFLLVFCILIIGFMGILFKIVLEKEIKEKETAIEQAIKTSFSNSQLKFAVIKSALEMVTESKALSNWAESNNDELFYFGTVQVQKEIIKAVSRVNNVNFQIATTYLDEKSLVVTPISSQSKDLFFKENLKLNDEQITNIFNHFNEESDYMVFKIERVLDNPEICYITKKNYSNRSILFFTTISFRSFFDESKDYEWYICNRKGIFASDNKANIPKKELYEFFAENNWIKQFEFKGNKVYTQSFDKIDWTLLTAYKTTRFDKKVFLLYFLIPCIMLTILALFVTRLITNLLYRPMKEVIDDIYDDSEQENTIDEFKLLKNNSNMIKSLNNQLKVALNERNTLIEQRFGRELLFGFNINRSNYPNSWLEDRNYCVALIEFMQKPYDDKEEDLFIYKNEIISYTQEVKSLRYVNVNFYTCALIIDTNTIEDAKVILYKMIEKIKIEEEQDFRIAISDVKYGISKIKECYDESRKILEYKFLFHQKTMLTMEQLKNLDHESYYYPLMIENKLIHSIINGDKNAINIFDELIHENEENLNLSPIAFKNLIFAIIATISRLMQELKVDSRQFLGEEDDFSSLSDQWNQENILIKLRDIFIEVIKFVNNKNQKSENLIAQEMLSYIHDNYSEDIMLIDMAEKLNISEKYCGILFKKTIGENYKNYLNKYRVEEAKKLIHKDTKIKVVELAKLVGFNSSNTFIRVFTKFTGMTPKKYAEKIKHISE